jgi:hypothetical protein
VDEPEKMAIETFDRLRLRTPLAESFAGLGFEGEAGWRAAARIKVLLLAESKRNDASLAPQPAKVALADKSTAQSPLPAEPVLLDKPTAITPKTTPPKDSSTLQPEPVVAGLPRDLWSDPDVRWLTGAHDAGAGTYLVLEPFEELSWWLHLPTLLRIAANANPKKAEVEQVSNSVKASIAVVEKAAYRLQTMLGEDKPTPSKPADGAKAAEPEPSGVAATPDESETKLDPELVNDAGKTEKKPV